MRVLGVGGLDHNGSLSVLEDGFVRGFLEVERVTRRKNAGLDSVDALDRTLSVMGIAAPVDRIGVADRVFWQQHRAWLEPALRERFGEVPLTVFHHHHCHAYAALIGSPFPIATVVTVDGKGDGLSALGMTADRRGVMTSQWVVPSPSSLGRLWWGVSEFCGLPGHHSAGKVMALAAYGDTPVEPWAGHLRLLEGGGFEVGAGDQHPDTFREVPRIVAWLAEVLGVEPGRPHAGLAAGLQQLTERVVCHLVGATVRKTGERRVCLAGGVALNGLANQRLLSEGHCDELFIPPCTDDRGLSLGAAALAHTRHGGALPVQPSGLSPFLGPERATGSPGLGWRPVEGEPTGAVAARIAAGEVVAVCRGASEAGPRALGHRSLLATPTDGGMRDRLNLQIKHREPFRPFGCAVIEDAVGDWFDIEGRSPYMLRIAQATARAREELPSALHADGTSRIQTVADDDGSGLAPLLRRLTDEGHPPVLLNTSLNRRGEPLVRTSDEAGEACLAMGVHLLWTDCGLYEASP